MTAKVVIGEVTVSRRYIDYFISKRKLEEEIRLVVTVTRSRSSTNYLLDIECIQVTH